jgi:hypothetical protein
MMLALLSNAILIGRTGYLVVFVIQLGFYATAACGMWTSWFAGSRLFKIPAFFVLANLSIVSAWYRYASGQRMVTWTPSDR